VATARKRDVAVQPLGQAGLFCGRFVEVLAAQDSQAGATESKPRHEQGPGPEILPLSHIGTSIQSPGNLHRADKEVP
jgi:hypothetical protein